VLRLSPYYRSHTVAARGGLLKGTPIRIKLRIVERRTRGGVTKKAPSVIIEKNKSCDGKKGAARYECNTDDASVSIDSGK
jgi:hypothetical protein